MLILILATASGMQFPRRKGGVPFSKLRTGGHLYPRGDLMESKQLKSMSIDQLMDLHQRVQLTLADKLQTEKTKIEERLRRIRSVGGVVTRDRRRRPYPPVLPKYKNPNDPTENWSGRGKQPLWVREQLEAGKKLDQFLIAGSRRQGRAAG
jgi:DNA-binding protein H-NS